MMGKTQFYNQLSRYDVIVIGSGFAGLSAAIECKMNGGNVIICEKMKAIGGNSVISDGGIAAPNTPEQISFGIEDSIELMFEDMMKSGEGLNDPTITKLVCDHAFEAFQWSKDVLGVKYIPRVDIFGGHSVPRCYSPDPLSGYTIIQKMKQKCDELGIEIKLQAYVESFILDKNRVIGVKIDSNYSLDPSHPKKMIDLYAKKGIIIATGGYAADSKFIQKHNSSFPSSFLTTNKKTTSAEVLESCIDMNCATAHLDLIQWMPWTTQNESGYGIGGLFGDYIVSSNGILIDCKSGLRFVNECGNRKQVTQEILRVKDVIGLVDSVSVKASGWNLEPALRQKIVQSFDSIEELAHTFNIPTTTLISTLNSYNSLLISNHNDPFGKRFEPWMTPIQTPPFYAMNITPKTHYTLGGLVTDRNTNVLDMNHQPIPGLYAVGEVTGLTHGANRLGSCSVTECLVMGRIAGKVILEKQSNIE